MVTQGKVPDPGARISGLFLVTYYDIDLGQIMLMSLYCLSSPVTQSQ